MGGLARRQTPLTAHAGAGRQMAMRSEKSRYNFAMADLPSSQLLARFGGPDEDAAADVLFRRYAEQLTALARSRLSRTLASRVDPEDVVQSAYRSFFLLIRTGEVRLHESGDL